MKKLVVISLILSGCASLGFKKEKITADAIFKKAAVEFVQRAKNEKWTCAKACKEFKKFIADYMRDDLKSSEDVGTK